MNGLLIVNGFLQSRKFEDIYSLLRTAAGPLGISLRTVKNTDLLHDRDRLPELDADFVLFWDKDVLLAELLESIGLRVFNQAKAIADCDDKARTYLQLSRRGLPCPRTVIAPLTFGASTSRTP